mgnify:FL=1
MKTVIIALGMLLSVTVSAQSFNQVVTGTVTGVYPQYQSVVNKVPRQTCTVVDVPVYGQGQASTGDVVMGAVIGGVIGNQIGEGRGKDAATVLGAIVGADKANKNAQRNGGVVGYRQEERCQTTYEREYTQQLTHYNVTIDANGQQIHARMNRKLNVGDEIQVTVKSTFIIR